MARWQRLRRLGAAGFWLALPLCGCGENAGYLESSITIASVCTNEARLAILVSLENPDDLPIDAVTASRTREESCFLERPARDAGAVDGGEADAAALYSCWEQGAGTYVVRVRSAKRTWTQSVEVAANSCHVSTPQELTFELD